MSDKKISGFKKFTDIKSKGKVEEIDLSIRPDDGSDIPMNPNIPKNSKRVERTASRKNIIPKDQNVELPSDEEEEIDESMKVKTFGRVAKFPKNVKASKAYNFLENVKVSKKSIWYIMVEKNDELQMLKYNYKEGVDLNKFVNELKTYYIKSNSDNKKVCEAISKIAVDGNDKYSMIKNIPPLKLNDKLLITRITEDLIKLLSK